MKNKEPRPQRLDEQIITTAAVAALRSLQLDTEVKSVRASGSEWRVEFAADYRQFCDSLRDQYGAENSFAVVREKIKRHILKQQQSKIKSGGRVRRGQPIRRSEPDSLLTTTVKSLEALATQTAAVTGGVINRAAQLSGQALAEIADAVDASAPAERTLSSQPVEPQPLARVRVRVAKSKQARKRSKPARATTTAKSRATKKTASKRKKTTVKSTSKSVRKRTQPKKSTKKGETSS